MPARRPARPATPATDVSEDVTALLSLISGADTMKDLAGVAKDPAFSTTYDAANAEEQQTIREHYEACRDLIQHNVDFIDLNGEEVTVEDVDVVPTRYGEMAIVRGKRRNGEPFQTKTSSVRTVRHFSVLLASETRDDMLPCKYVFTKEQHPDDDTKTMWNFKRIPRAQTAGSLPWQN